MTPLAPRSLKALLNNSVDYAGLFPPAELDLEPALENHAAYFRGPDAWMLAGSVLPATKLREVGPLLVGRFDPVYPLRISALGTKTKSPDEFLQSLRTSMGELESFRHAHGGESAIDQFESPLPPTCFGPALHDLLGQAVGLIETLQSESLRAFWEIPFSEDLPVTLRGIAEFNAVALPTTLRRQFGAKLRTGGTEAAAFPTCQQLAGALVAARDAGAALKFTAGLHHPLRHFNAELGTRMHGFLNVFAAGVLAREHRLDAAETQAILEDERSESFRFEDEGFAWRGRYVQTAALPAHREFITSFGSCSFDEPCGDLRRLGLLA